MKIDMSLLLRDVPGSLVAALDPISRQGGNILSVQHSRGKNGYAEVAVTFEVKDKNALSRIKKALVNTKISVQEILVEGRAYQAKHTLPVMVVGHVIDTDIQGTIDRINEVGLVSDLDVVMPDPDKESSVMFTVDVDARRLDELYGVIDDICRKKDFLLVSSLEK